jgi:hypothetical protein
MAGGAEKLPGPLFDVSEPIQSGLESAEKARPLARRVRQKNNPSALPWKSVDRSGQESIAQGLPWAMLSCPFGASPSGRMTSSKHIQVPCSRNDRTLGNEVLGFSGKYPS